MTITVPYNGLIDIVEFKKVLDISRCVYYSLKKNRDGTLTLKFYDFKRKAIKPYGPEKETKKNKSKKIKNK